MKTGGSVVGEVYKDSRLRLTPIGLRISVLSQNRHHIHCSD